MPYLKGEEVRINLPTSEWFRYLYYFSNPWTGKEDLKNKTIVYFGEQGNGDQIQFLRFLPLLRQYDCKIIVHIPRRLQRIVQCLDGAPYQCIDLEDPFVPEHDYHVLSQSLPFILKPKITNEPYIFVKEKLSLPENLNNKVKIGIAWEGNPINGNNTHRNCPLKHFKYLLNLPNVQLFSLMQKVHTESLVEECEDMDLLGTELTDYYDTAVYLNALDFCVTVDTSVMHLAGALGKKVYCMLPNINQDERWRFNWYKSVQLFTNKNDWDETIKVVTEQIKKDYFMIL